MKKTKSFAVAAFLMAAMAFGTASAATTPSPQPTNPGNYYSANGCTVFEYDGPNDPANGGQIFVKCGQNIVLQRVSVEGYDLRNPSSTEVGVYPAPSVWLNARYPQNDTWREYNFETMFYNPKNDRTYMIEYAAHQPTGFTPVIVNAASGKTIISAKAFMCPRAGNIANNPRNLSLTTFGVTGHLLSTQNTPAVRYSIRGQSCF